MSDGQKYEYKIEIVSDHNHEQVAIRAQELIAFHAREGDWDLHQITPSTVVVDPPSYGSDLMAQYDVRALKIPLYGFTLIFRRPAS